MVELEVCAEYRIPHSQFLQWSNTDRAKAIHQFLEAKSKCGSCGTSPDEWNEKLGGSRFAYKAEAMICRGCQVKSSEEKRLEKQGQTGGGLFITLIRNVVRGRNNG